MTDDEGESTLADALARLRAPLVPELPDTSSTNTPRREPPPVAATPGDRPRSRSGSATGSLRPGADWPDIDDDQLAPGPRRPRRLLLMAAAVPWLAIAAMLMLRAPSSTPGPSPGTPGAAASDLGPAADQPLAVATLRDADASRAPIPTAAGAGLRTAASDADARALALLTARAVLGSSGPALAIDATLLEGPWRRASAATYVEHVLVEAVDHPPGDHVVVTVVAVLLDVVEERYGPARLERLAVPITVRPTGVRIAGRPWALPAPELPYVEPLWTTIIEEPELLAAASQALASAGYRDVALISLERTDGWPGLVTADAMAPGQRTMERHRVWVRPDGDGLVVAGWLVDTVVP